MYGKLKLKLTDEERFRLRYMYAYEMEKKNGKVNVRKLCLLFGIGKSTFYKSESGSVKMFIKCGNICNIKSFHQRKRYAIGKG